MELGLDDSFPDELTESVRFKNGSSIRFVKVHFFSEHDWAELFGTSVSTTAPRLIAREADLIGLTKSCQFLRGADVYNVLEPQPDGHGLVTVLLSKD